MKNKKKLVRWRQYQSAAYRRWRVYSTFLTGFGIGLLYVLLISGIWPGWSEPATRTLVLIFSGILGGVIYTILVDGHVEMPRFVTSHGNKFEAGLFGDILLGIAGSVVLDFIAASFEMAPMLNTEVAAAGIVGGYGGRAILQFALGRVIKDVNLLEADRRRYLQANLQQRLTAQLVKKDALALIDQVNQQISTGLAGDELSQLIADIKQASAALRKQIFDLAKEFRRTAKLSGETDRIERALPIFVALVESDPQQHAYYAELAFTYKDARSPDLLRAIQCLDKAIDLRGNQHRAETWRYELSRAIARIQAAQQASGTYDFDAFIHDRIIADLLAVAKIYNLETILKAFDDQTLPVPVIAWMEQNQAMLAVHPEAKTLLAKLDARVESETLPEVLSKAPSEAPSEAVLETVPEASSEVLGKVTPKPVQHLPQSRTQAADNWQPPQPDLGAKSDAEISVAMARWQKALAKAKTKGASDATAKQDRLEHSGISASHAMAKNDWPRIRPLIERFCRAGAKFDVPPALLAAIASRESRCGNPALLVKGWGDHGNAFGIMQIDRRHHTVAGAGADVASQAHIDQAAELLSQDRKAIQRRHPTWRDELVLEGTAVAYNSGAGNVRTEAGLNKGTTGNDYGADVIARSQFYLGKFGPLAAPEGSILEISISERDLPADVPNKDTSEKDLLKEQVEVKQIEGKQIDGDGESVLLALTGSVGLGGKNNPQDVLAVKERLEQLGFGFFKVNNKKDAGLIDAIRLFQSIIYGSTSRRGDGRIDARGKTHRFLEAANAPRWIELPIQGEGFINHERRDTRDDHDYGTSWISDVIVAAGRYYEANYRRGDNAIAPMYINDVSKPEGGFTEDHAGHECGNACDVYLPRKGGDFGGITWKDKTLYDQAAARAQLKALKAQKLVTRIFFNDPQLQKEQLCVRARGHDNHIHFEIGVSDG